MHKGMLYAEKTSYRPRMDYVRGLYIKSPVNIDGKTGSAIFTHCSVCNEE